MIFELIAVSLILLYIQSLDSYKSIELFAFADLLTLWESLVYLENKSDLLASYINLSNIYYRHSQSYFIRSYKSSLNYNHFCSST